MKKPYPHLAMRLKSGRATASPSIHPLVLLLLLLSPACGLGEDVAVEKGAAKQTPMPVVVEPYYSAKGPTIHVGAWSDEIANANADSILKVADKMKRDQNTLPIEAMYVLAIRLYDLGKKDEAVRWFYTAELRRWLFKRVVDQARLGGIGSPGFESFHAQIAFQQTAGEFINGYGFGDVAKLSSTLKAVRDEANELPDFAAAYPQTVFIDKAAWPEKNKDVMHQVDEMLNYLEKNVNEIKAARKKNGIEGKY